MSEARPDADPLDLPDLARLLSSPARSAMLVALLHDRACAAGELGRMAGVATSTASEHLAALQRGGLVTSLQSGRHRYYRLRDAAVAETLESWFRLAPPPQPRTLRASSQARRLAFARTCYDHLAGTLGVAVHAALLDRGWLRASTQGYDVAAAGELGLTRLGVDVAGLRAGRRSLARPCLDWTERRLHLAGSLASALCTTWQEQGWLTRDRSRGVEVTVAGLAGLRECLGVDVVPPAADSEGRTARA